MKRGDDTEILIVEDLLCEIRACGVGNGIMRVNQIKFFELCHLHHFTREGRRIQRKIKQRIGGHFDFVIEDVVNESVQPHRHRIADEMYLMSSLGKRFSELRCDNAASAVCGITGDSDFHFLILS